MRDSDVRLGRESRECYGMKAREKKKLAGFKKLDQATKSAGVLAMTAMNDGVGESKRKWS